MAVLAAAKYVADEEAFCFTYGDGLSDIDMAALIASIGASKKATITAVRPPAVLVPCLFAVMTLLALRKNPRETVDLKRRLFRAFPDCLDLIASDDTVWEQEPSESRQNGEIVAFHHAGFGSLWTSEKKFAGCYVDGSFGTLEKMAD